MKTKILFAVLLISFLWAASCSNDNLSPISQEEGEPIINCRTDLAMAEHFQLSPVSREAMERFEEFTRNHVDRFYRGGRTQAGSYNIPVVFHVYGTDFAGKTVNDATIINALQKVNEDFHGLNDDYNTVDPYFQSLRSAFDVTFKLATRDPQGNPTTGIVYYPAKSGYGNRSADDEVAADAWDNYKYCNVYIQLDLYDNGALNNSGVAWYPDVSMSDDNTARIVYNGRYLYGNTNKEFASTLSHEFGHWWNLIHTFEGGCRKPNETRCATTGDRVCDTPQASSNDVCSTLTNCVKKRVNTENYMGYSGAGGCYKMFTVGQVARMEAATQHPARVTLWQQSNLTATGI
ncbi:MAG: M43 family zinc metalloprotease [Bacteroidota bacterium]